MEAPESSTPKRQQRRAEAAPSGGAAGGRADHAAKASRADLLLALAADLQDQAGELRAAVEQSVAALEATSARLKELVQGARATQPTASGGAREARAYGGSGSRAAPSETRRRERPKSAKAKAKDEAMLRATRMAIAGVGRKQIASALRKELDVHDPDPILDRVLGSGR